MTDMRAELSYKCAIEDGDETVSLHVVLTCGEDPGLPGAAGTEAGLAFDAWLHELVDREFQTDEESGLRLEAGHIVSVESEEGLFVKRSCGVVLEAVMRLSRTGASPTGVVPHGEGEWLLSKRTGRWRLEADIFPVRQGGVVLSFPDAGPG